MRTHITIVAILRIGRSLLGLAVGTIVALILGGAGVGAWYDGSPEALPILGAIAAAVLVIVFALSVPGIVGGVGLLKDQNWARYLVLVLSVFDLFTPPIGTAVGIYTIWALTDRRTAELFEAS